MMKIFLAVLFSALFLQTNGQGNGAVRLNRNGNTDLSNTNGVVEVYYNSRWGPVCIKDSSYNHIGDVVCHQLGFTGGSSGSTSNNHISTKPVFSNLQCKKKDLLMILQCQYESDVSYCQPFDNVEVHCNTARIWDDPYSGMIRLQGGNYSGQGLVQYYCKGKWKYVCNDALFFNGETADVVCTQLGYNDHQTYNNVPYHNGTAWLHDANCYSASSKKCLSECVGGSCPDTYKSCNSYTVTVTCSFNEASDGGTNTIGTCKKPVLSGGGIAGIVISVAAAMVFAIVIGVACYNRKKIAECCTRNEPEERSLIRNDEQHEE